MHSRDSGWSPCVVVPDPNCARDCVQTADHSPCDRTEERALEQKLQRNLSCGEPDSPGSASARLLFFCNTVPNAHSNDAGRVDAGILEVVT
eukprot:1187675-Prorocentrum_minimum.AAC.1